MNIARLTKAIADEDLRVLATVQGQRVLRLLEGLVTAKRIFCIAQGRSGNVLRCFCMRLMHLGYESYFAGETITPKIGAGDMVVVLSGSGQTTCTVELARVARQQGARTYGVIGVQDSPLARTLDDFVILPTGAKLTGSKNGDSLSIQPPGSLFEQAAFLLLEAVILELYQRQGSDGKGLLERHTNLE